MEWDVTNDWWHEATIWMVGEVDTEVDTEHVTKINVQCEMNCADFVYAKWIGAESGMCYCLLFDVKIMCSGAWCDVMCDYEYL